MRIRRHSARKTIGVLVTISLLLAAAGLFVFYRATRPLPAYAVTLTVPQAAAPQAVAFDWSSSGAAIIGQADGRVLGRGPQADTKLPTASTIKLLTALTILKKYPLTPDETGPSLTMTDADVALYDAYVARGGSAVRVEAGETISEHEALEAMLLPSANNIADSVAIWAFGSLEGYHAQARLVADGLGMSATTLGPDASGYASSSVSTAADLFLLGRAAYAEPVIAAIASRPTATLPLVGPVQSTNEALTKDGINGLKTGTGDEGSNSFVFSAEHTFPNGNTGAFVGVIMGAPDSSARFSQAQALLTTAYGHYRTVTAAQKGQPVGRATAAWGAGTDVVAATDLSSFSWSDDAAAVSTVAAPTPARHKGDTVATLKLGNQSVPLVLSANVPSPSLFWRVFH